MHNQSSGNELTFFKNVFRALDDYHQTEQIPATEQRLDQDFFFLIF